MSVLQVVGGLIMVTSLSGLSSSLDGLHGGQDEVRDTHIHLLTCSESSTEQPLHFLSQLEVQTTGHIVLYVFGSVTMAISILGAFGGYRENLVAVVVVSRKHRAAALRWTTDGLRTSSSTVPAVHRDRRTAHAQRRRRGCLATATGNYQPGPNDVA